MPLGEERQHINEAIDKMLETLKERGILHERPEQDKSKASPLWKLKMSRGKERTVT